MQCLGKRAADADVAVIRQDHAATIAERAYSVVADFLCAREGVVRHGHRAAEVDEHLVDDGWEAAAENGERCDERRVGVDDGLGNSYDGACVDSTARPLARSKITISSSRRLSYGTDVGVMAMRDGSPATRSLTLPAEPATRPSSHIFFACCQTDWRGFTFMIVAPVPARRMLLFATMTRFTLLACTALLAAGCYHDNASPFVHGGGNRPETWGSTWAPASGSRVLAAGSGSYSASSGYAGGYEMEGEGASMPATSTSMGTAPSAMSSPTGMPSTTTTAPVPPLSAPTTKPPLQSR